MKQNKLLLVGVSAFLLSCPQAFAQDGSSISADDFLKNQPSKSQNSNNQPELVEGQVNENKGGSVKGISTAPELSDIEKSIEQAKSELDDEKILARKMELAKEMHKIRPTRNQVDAAVLRASFAFPRSEQAKFINAMSSMLNYNAIERISIDAMLETYTLKELESMVEYYSKPEAKSASMKVSHWAELVQPEVTNMIDKAMMRIRTGQ